MPHPNIVIKTTFYYKITLEMLLTAVSLVVTQMDMKVQLYSAMKERKKMVVTILLHRYPSPALRLSK